MSLPLLHAGKSAPGLSAALDLRFALDKSLTAYRGPTPSFSRASTGSYFDGSGVLRYANVNTILYSEEFDNAYWTKVRSSVTANNSTSPTGKNSADLITQTSGQTIAGGITRTISWVSGTTYTASIYAKKIDKNRIMIIERSTGDGRGTFFNISNGTVGTKDPNHTASIQDAGNGWYRCSITFLGSTISDSLTIYHVDNESTTVIDSGSTLFWGAQLEASSTVGTYCPTTSSANSAPRFNHTYNGTSWVSRGLLVEEQRTNLATNSQEFNSGAYIKEAGSVSANTATAPDGTVTADKFIPSATNDDHSIYQTFSPSTYAISVFAKADGYNYLFIGRDNTAANYGAFFDLVNGTVSQNTSGGTTSIINVGNGWFRCSISMSAVQYALLATSENGTSFVHLGDGTKGVLLWGYQVESGSFPTSYIPTTSASVTRSADVCQITGSDFSGFWNGTEGSIAAEYDLYSPSVGSAQSESFLWQVDDGTNNNRILVTGTSGSTASNKNRYAVITTAGTQALLDNQVVPANVSVYSSATWKLNDAAFYSGSNGLFDTSVAIPAGQSSLRIGQRTGDYYLNGHIARLRYFNKRLPNATLQQLST